MKILLLSKYSRLGASSRLRTLQYVPYLEENGFDVTVNSLFDDEYLTQLYQNGSASVVVALKCYFKRLSILFTCLKYDVIWIEYEIFPFFPAFFERSLRFIGKKYVVDYDDAIFHNYDLSGNFIVRKLLGCKIDAVMRNSACVIAGNEYLASRAISAGAPCVELIPTVVDHSRYVPRDDLSSATPVIGWIGSPSTQKYVVSIADALATACRSYGARLMLVGATPQIVAEFPGVDVDVVPWSEDSEAELIRQMDIGIMPLPDGPWEKGKCGYKLIQYMACSVPVIASPVGANVEIVNISHSGLLAGSMDEWKEALVLLLADPTLRKQFGAAGRQAVETTYSLQAQAPILLGIFHETIHQSRV